MKMNEAVVCTFGGRTQLLRCGDLEDEATRDWWRHRLPDRVAAVYSDPPWNPGNASYWRTHAGLDKCQDYDRFLDAWCDVVVAALARGAKHVLNEQSVNDRHRGMFLDAVGRHPQWTLPLLEEWEVYYGSPGSASRRRPNQLLHFGHTRLATDPSGMRGEPMTIRVCAGLQIPTGAWIIDPCMGKGMTSRMAHYFGWDCMGSELNPKRLAKTVEWLERQGYTVSSL